MDLSFKERDLKKLAGEQNIADLMTEEDAGKIGMRCLDGYRDDKTSRTRWEEWYAEAMKLALQVKEAKSFPWPNCSNIRFPLMTIAGLNFHAKAYSGIISGDSVVKCRAIGADPDGQKQARAVRVGKHMSYQLLECSPWEEQTDKGLFVVAIMGCGFKKTIRDNNAKKNCSDFVMPQDLVLNYYTTDIETTPRASHRFTLTRNELRENINARLYREPPTHIAAPTAIDPLKAAQDQAQKLTPPDPSHSVHFLIEQSCFLDLDGDGYEEPYAVTFDEATGFVYRIIARYYPSDIKYVQKDGKDTKTVLRIVPENYYTKIPFIPSPDGGFYDVGLGILLGPITESVSTLINQITDWATMSITSGGFIGRGVRMKAGETTFKPLEWKTVDSTGDDLHKNIVPLPIKELSPVLLDLLKFLVNYGERIAGSGDIQVGELPGQNVKAGTMQIANENGRLIFNAIFKRIWRALKEEFKKLYRLNQYFQEDEEFTYGEKFFKVTKADYQHPDSGIVPAADPNLVSKQDRRQQADMLATKAMQTPGYDKEAVEKRWLEAYEIAGWESLYDLKKFPPQPPPKMLEIQAKQQREETLRMREQTRMLEMKQKGQMALSKLLSDIQFTQAKIFELNAKAALELKQAQGVDIGHAIAAIDLQIGAENKHLDRLMHAAQMMMDAFKDSHDEGGVSGVEKGSPDGGVLPMAVALQDNGNGGMGQPQPAA